MIGSAKETRDMHLNWAKPWLVGAGFIGASVAVTSAVHQILGVCLGGF